MDNKSFVLRVRVSVRVASARAWVKTRQGIGASKVMEGGQSCVSFPKIETPTLSASRFKYIPWMPEENSTISSGSDLKYPNFSNE
jgi:hypothetical protein